MPTRAARAVDRALAAMAPSLEGLVGGHCPECGAEVALRFDPLTYTMLELRDTFAGIYRETHALASAYGWSEEDNPAPAAKPAPALRGHGLRGPQLPSDPTGGRMVSPAKGAVPGYLARLAGGASADAPRLQPPRPLFSSVAGAIKDAGPEPAVAGIDGHPGLVQHGSARIRRGPVTASPGTDIAASSVGYQASQRISHTQALDGGAPDPLPAPPVPPMRGRCRPGPSAVPHANSIQANTDSSPA